MDLQTLTSSAPINKDIPIDLLLDYSSKGLTYRDIAKLAGCSAANVHQRIKAVNFDPNHLRAYKDNRADLLAWKQRELILSLDSAEIKAMQPRDRIVSYGILYDKERLERGQATSITGYEGLPDDGLLAKMQALMDKASRIGIRVTEIVGEIPASLRDSINRLPGTSHDGLINTEHNMEAVGK
jgi:hypothetical protein